MIERSEALKGGCAYILVAILVAYPFVTITWESLKMEAADITNILTASLGAATVWLAYETRKMAVAAKASIDLESQPYLSIRGLYLQLGWLRDFAHPGSGAARTGVKLSNPGKVLVTYQVDQMTATVAAYTINAPHFETKGGVIHPGEETTFFFPIIHAPAQIQAPTDGEVQIAITFWAIPTEKRTVSAKLRMLITSTNPLHWEWLYLEGPTYGT